MLCGIAIVAAAILMPLECDDAELTMWWLSGSTDGALSCEELANLGFCEDAFFGADVTSTCPSSCGLCASTTSTTTQYPCVDIEGPTTLSGPNGAPTCAEAVALGGCEEPFNIGERLNADGVRQCPLSCGECTTTTTTTLATETRNPGCICADDWAVVDAVCKDGTLRYDGCGMAEPCDGDRGGGPDYPTWCVVKDASCNPDGRTWDYCRPDGSSGVVPSPPPPPSAPVPLATDDATAAAEAALGAGERVVSSNGTAHAPWCSWSGSTACPATFGGATQDACAQALCEAGGWDFVSLVGFDVDMCAEGAGQLDASGGWYYDPFGAQVGVAPAGEWAVAATVAVCVEPPGGQRTPTAPPPPPRTRGDCTCSDDWLPPAELCTGAGSAAYAGCGMVPPCDGTVAIDIDTRQRWPSWCVVDAGCPSPAGTASAEAWDFCIPTPTCAAGEVVDAETGACEPCPAGTAALPNVDGCSDCTAVVKGIRLAAVGFSGTCNELAMRVAAGGSSSGCGPGCSAGVSIGVILVIVAALGLVIRRHAGRKQSKETALDGWRSVTTSPKVPAPTSAPVPEVLPATPLSATSGASLFDRARASQRAATSAKERTSKMLSTIGTESAAMMDRLYADEMQEVDAELEAGSEFDATVSALADKLAAPKPAKSRPPPLDYVAPGGATAFVTSSPGDPVGGPAIRRGTALSEGYIDLKTPASTGTLGSAGLPKSGLSAPPVTATDGAPTVVRRSSIELDLDRLPPLADHVDAEADQAAVPSAATDDYIEPGAAAVEGDVAAPVAADDYIQPGEQEIEGDAEAPVATDDYIEPEAAAVEGDVAAPVAADDYIQPGGQEIEGDAEAPVATDDYIEP